jgi:hypothetical protein
MHDLLSQFILSLLLFPVFFVSADREYKGKKYVAKTQKPKATSAAATSSNGHILSRV